MFTSAYNGFYSRLAYVLRKEKLTYDSRTLQGFARRDFMSATGFSRGIDRGHVFELVYAFAILYVRIFSDHRRFIGFGRHADRRVGSLYSAPGRHECSSRPACYRTGDGWA